MASSGSRATQMAFKQHGRTSSSVKRFAATAKPVAVISSKLKSKP